MKSRTLLWLLPLLLLASGLSSCVDEKADLYAGKPYYQPAQPGSGSGSDPGSGSGEEPQGPGSGEEPGGDVEPDPGTEPQEPEDRNTTGNAEGMNSQPGSYPSHPILRVSLLGDSISTFRGWLASGETAACRYPKGDVDSVEKTWWYLFTTQWLGGVVDTNDSWSGTTIKTTTSTSSPDFVSRYISHGGVGHPDVILIYGGTNEFMAKYWGGTGCNLAAGMNIGTTEKVPESTMKSYLDAADAATTKALAEALPTDTYCESYIKLLQMIKIQYPAAKVVCIIGDWFSEGMEKAILDFAPHFGARVVDILAVGGFDNPAIEKQDGGLDQPSTGCHPTAAGMAFIARQIWLSVGSWLLGEEE